MKEAVLFTRCTISEGSCTLRAGHDQGRKILPFFLALDSVRLHRVFFDSEDKIESSFFIYCIMGETFFYILLTPAASVRVVNLSFYGCCVREYVKNDEI